MRRFTTEHFNTHYSSKFKNVLLPLCFALIGLSLQAQTQASGIAFEPIPGANQTTSLKIKWTNGSGSGRLVVIKDAASTFTPANGADITASVNADFGSANDIDGGANVAKPIVFDVTSSGSPSSINVSGLPSNIVYRVQIYEFTGSTTNPTYVTTTNATNPIAFQFFTSNGTFNVPAAVTKVKVQALGGGGGGGGADSNGTENRAGGGGAGGSYTENTSVTVTAGGSVAVTVGLGGTAGDGGDDRTNGGTGGTSSFGALVTAIGGSGGVAGISGNRTGAGAGTTVGTTRNGGAGAEAPPTGDINAVGSGGGGGSAGITGDGNAAGTSGVGISAGIGGNGGGGAGANGRSGLTAGTVGIGVAATEFGGGGSGGWDNTADINTEGSDADGGAGSGGYVIVSYDNTPPTLTLTLPAASTSVKNANVTYTISESLQSGSISWVRTGGTADGNSHVQALTGAELTTNQTNYTLSNNPTNLVDGTIYDVIFTGTDLAGNIVASPITNGSVTFDTSPPADFTTGDVITDPGLTTGFYNISNTTGIVIPVPIADDNSLINGKILIEVSNNGAGGSYIPLVSNVNIPAKNTTQNVVIDNTTLTANGKYGDGNTLHFRATITDIATNPKVGAVATRTLKIDKTAPTLTLTKPANSGYVNSDQVTYTLNESLISGSIVYHDGVTPLTKNLAAGELTTNQTNYSLSLALVNGTVYTVTFSGTDLAGNPATPIVNSNVTFETNAPSVLSINRTNASPSTNASEDFTVTFSEPVATSSVTTADFIPAMGTGVTGATITGVTAVSPSGGFATVYTVTIGTIAGDGTLGLDKTADPYTDRAGNNSTTSRPSDQTYTIDNTGPTIGFTLPATGGFYNHARVTYTIGEAIQGGGASYIRWTRTSGSTDATIHTQNLTGVSELSSGGITNAALTNAPTLVNGAVYTVDFVAADALGNTSTLQKTNVEFDNGLPSAFTTGAVTAVTGRVRPGFYNSTNTGGINITVPVSAADATLINGAITMYVQIGAGAFNLVASTPATIGASGNNTINISAATIAGLGIADQGTLTFRARITDRAGNFTDGTASTTIITYDVTAPSVSVGPKIYESAGKEVVQIIVSENLLRGTESTPGTLTANDNSTAVTGNGTSFLKLLVGSDLYTGTTYIGRIAAIADDTNLTLAAKWQGPSNADLTNVSYTFKGFQPADNIIDGFATDGTGAIGIVAYRNDGTQTVKDNTVTNTRLIYIESSANGSNWTTSNFFSYTRTNGSGNGAGEYLYDIAGNELTAFNLQASGGDVINPFIQPDVISWYPDPFGGNNVKLKFTLNEPINITPNVSNNITGFSITNGGNNFSTLYTESSPGVCPCTITLTYTGGGANVWSPGFTQVSYSGGNIYDFATPAALPMLNFFNHPTVPETEPPVITDVTIPDVAMKVGNIVTVTITTEDDDNQEPFLLPSTVAGYTLSNLIYISPTQKTAQFTVTDPGTDYTNIQDIPVSIQLQDPLGNNSTVYNNNISQGNDPIDANRPDILSVTRSQATIFEGQLVQTVTVTYNEAMNNSSLLQPTIQLINGGSNWGAQTFSGGTNGWSVGNTVYTATFTHTATQENLTGVYALVNTNAQDLAGNTTSATNTSTTFLVDNLKPTVSSITALTTPANTNAVTITNNVLRVRVVFSESMKTSVAPTLTFSTSLPNLSGAAGVWSTTTFANDTYTRDYTHNGTVENLSGLTVSVSGAFDAASTGNAQSGSTSSGTFRIDTQRPTVTSIVRSSTNQYTNTAGSVSYIVTFSEAVTVDAADFTPFKISGTVAVGTVSGVSAISSSQYTITVSGYGTGDGDVRLDVSNSTATITDAFGNLLNVSKTGDEIYTIDHTAPTISSITRNTAGPTYSNSANGITPSLVSNSVQYTFAFSEPVKNFSSTAGYVKVYYNNTVAPNPVLAFPGPVSMLTIGATTTTPAPDGSAASWQFPGTYAIGAGVNANTGPIQIDYDNTLNGTLTDRAGNLVSNSLAGSYYNFALEEPNASVTAFNTSSTLNGTSLTVNWTDVIGTIANTATHYLVVLSTNATDPSSGGSPLVADGGYIADDNNLGDGYMYHNVTKGTQTTTFSGLTDDVNYTVFIFPYTLSPNNVISGTNRTAINYRTASVAKSSRTSSIALATFANVSNVNYQNFQETTLTSGGSWEIERFNIVDDGGDNLDTRVSSLAIDITNIANLRQVAIFDGATKIQELSASSAVAGRLTFNAFVNPLIVTNNTTKAISIKASFNQNNIVDNQIISASIYSIAAVSTPASSQFKATLPVGVASSLSSNENKIEVIANHIDFTTVPAAASVNVSFTVVAQARDASPYLNVDLDYNGAVTFPSGTNTSGFNVANQPAGPFVAGVLNYPTDNLGTSGVDEGFQFTSGNTSTSLLITGGTTADVGSPITGTSSVIGVTTAYDSWVYFDTSYPYTAQIDYVSNTNDPVTAANPVIAKVILSDGGAMGSSQIDIDGAYTAINSFTMSINNPQDLQKIAIYQSDGTTKIGSDYTPAASVTFTGLSSFQAPDNGVYPFFIRASYKNIVVDQDQILMQVTSVSHNSGSKFPEQNPAPPNPLPVAGVQGAGGLGDSSPNTINYIDVIATSLDFIKQPGKFAGVYQKVDTTAIIRARNIHQIIDTDFNYTASVSRPVGFVDNSYSGFGSSFIFNQGELKMDSINYQSAGNGTLTISANSLTNTSNNVDVLDVYLNQDFNGVSTKANLNAGATNQFILGFRLQPQHKTTSQPRFKSFRVKFYDKNGLPSPYETAGATTFKNLKLWISTSPLPNAATATLVPATDVTVTGMRSYAYIQAGGPATSHDMAEFTFATNKYPALFDANNPVTIYLSVDVDIAASNGTKPLRAQIDKSYNRYYGAPDYTGRKNAVDNYGSIQGSAYGNIYGFASTKPPAIIASNPSSGQLNVNPTLSVLSLTFDVDVTTFDAKAILWDKYSNTQIAVLPALNNNGNVYVNNTADGVIPDLSTVVNKTVEFDLSGVTLIPDSVYYITIANGYFNINKHSDRAGISDKNFNTFGGINFNGTLYFKISSPKPPDMVTTAPGQYFYGTSTTVINASFDRYGKAYYMVVDQGAPAPTIPQITDPLAGYANTVYFRGTMDIDQVYPNFNYGVIDVALPSNYPANYNDKLYDVWMYAENDAQPTPISTSAPYGPAPNFDPDGTVKTFPLSVPWYNIYNPWKYPNYQICSGSNVKLIDPIILGEYDGCCQYYYGGLGGFSDASQQTLNLLLPTGFKFDVTKTPDVKLIGADFLGTSPIVSFVNSAILQIKFTNSGSTSLDNIIISNMYVSADATGAQGSITRFTSKLGTYWDNFLGEGYSVAQISSIAAPTIPFTNSFSEDTSNNFGQAPLNLTGNVTYIPDNYFDTNLGKSAVRLLPNAPKGDYGPSSFTGTGLINDILNLNSVPLNTGFNITLVHTDMNGCVSNETNQYYVYDHKTAIAALGTEQCIVNPNFPAAATNPIDITKFVDRNDIAGFKLLELVANVTSKATDPNDATPLDTDQIMYGAAWDAVIKQIPVEKLPSIIDPITNDVTRSFYWDYNKILNANIIDPSIPNPYDNFKQPNPTPFHGKTFYKGGSLGYIDFVGKYRSIADFTVLAPFRQQVQIFLPAIPVVEEATRPTYTTSTGTLIFCQGTGGASDIQINGYPLASPGSSDGYFTLYDSATNNPLVYTAAEFKDNLNGTSVLKSTYINRYKTIRVDYTYQDIGSPCSGTGSLYIRITPNPIPRFTASSLLNEVNALKFGGPIAIDSYCEDNVIRFRNKSIWPKVPGFTDSTQYRTNRTAEWVLSSSVNVNFPGLAPTQFNPDSARFVYESSGKYTVTFTVASQYGCQSSVGSRDFYIGAIPQAKFSLTGIATNTPVVVTDNSIVADAPGVNSAIVNAQWIYGPSTAKVTTTTNSYTIPGTYTVSLVSSTSITSVPGGVTLSGCQKQVNKEVIIVPYINASTTNNYIFDAFDAGGPRWIPDTTKVSLSAPSWQKGVVTKAKLASISTGSNSVWATGLSANYNVGEVSYLYSPSYNIVSMQRPMASFDQIAYMGGTTNPQANNDGVAFEYSVDTLNAADPAKKWFRIGTNDDGNHWYNEQGLASSPGDQFKYPNSSLAQGDYGWSGREDNPVVSQSQHTVSYDVPSGTVARSHVQFRFAFASTAQSPGSEGFAVDNFRIGERTRIILLENFTNAGETDPAKAAVIKAQNDYLIADMNSTGANTLVEGVDYIKLNYHVGFPQKDPFNLNNPDDPSARALYYNISSVPDTRMDGLASENPKLDVGIISNKISDWGLKGFDSRTLELAGANIQFLNATSTAGQFKVQVQVTALEDFKPGYLLHVALVEDLVSLASLSNPTLVKTGETQFEYVVKALLPTASGTKFKTKLDSGQFQVFNEMIWSPDKSILYSPQNDIRAVAFVQDDATKEIIQAVMSGPITDPVIVTGDLTNPFSFEEISIYPNPADQELNIVFPSRLTKDVPIMMFDQMGRIMHSTKASKGEQSAVLQTGNASDGVYILQLDLGDGRLSRAKVIINHND